MLGQKFEHIMLSEKYSQIHYWQEKSVWNWQWLKDSAWDILYSCFSTIFNKLTKYNTYLLFAFI